MLTLVIPHEQNNLLIASLRKAGRREIGGILMGEHAGPNLFIIREISVHNRGSFAYFVRRIEDALAKINSYFQATSHNYIRFNYLGEWHSHPSFAPFPSATDDESMLQIVQDEKVGANFVVLLIAKLEGDGNLTCTAHTYLPDGSRTPSILKLS